MLTPVETDPAELTTSQITNQMLVLRDEKRKLAAQEKPLDDQYKILEKALITKMNQEGSVGVKTTFGSATLTEQDIPIIEDQEAFNEFVMTNNALYLLQNRLSQTACLELETMGELPPGLKILKRQKIALRSI